MFFFKSSRIFLIFAVLFASSCLAGNTPAMIWLTNCCTAFDCPLYPIAEVSTIASASIGMSASSELNDSAAARA